MANADCTPPYPMATSPMPPWAGLTPGTARHGFTPDKSPRWISPQKTTGAGSPGWICAPNEDLVQRSVSMPMAPQAFSSASQDALNRSLGHMPGAMKHSRHLSLMSPQLSTRGGLQQSSSLRAPSFSRMPTIDQASSPLLSARGGMQSLRAPSFSTISTIGQASPRQGGEFRNLALQRQEQARVWLGQEREIQLAKQKGEIVRLDREKEEADRVRQAEEAAKRQKDEEAEKELLAKRLLTFTRLEKELAAKRAFEEQARREQVIAKHELEEFQRLEKARFQKEDEDKILYFSERSQIPCNGQEGSSDEELVVNDKTSSELPAFLTKVLSEDCLSVATDRSSLQKVGDRVRESAASWRATTAMLLQNSKFRVTAVSAAGGAVTVGTGGAAVGCATGGAIGAAVGLVPALFTFGLSIPVGAAIGGGAGLCVGATAGGTVGAVGGGAAGYKIHGYRTSASS